MMSFEPDSGGSFHVVLRSGPFRARIHMGNTSEVPLGDCGCGRGRSRFKQITNPCPTGWND